MNKFTLKFLDASLEEQYQEQKLTSIRKPLYYGIAGFSLLLNLMKVTLDIVRNKPLTQYFNFIYIFFLIFGIFIMCKHRKYQKYAILIPNILAGLFQLNFDEAQTMKQEFFSFGSSFAQLEAVGYFVSDVPDGLLQVVCHLVMKIAITSIKSNKTDPLATILGIIAGILMILVVYTSDFNARKQYLSAICDQNWDVQLPYLVKKPYIQLTFDDDKYKVKQCNKIQDFPGISTDEFCYGCKARQFLKECKVKGEQLYNILISDDHLINQELQAALSYHRFIIKICRFGVEKYNRFIILEKVITKIKTKSLPYQLRKDLFTQLEVSGQRVDCLRFYNWGMLSFVLMNNLIIQQLDLRKQIRKLNNTFKRYLRLQMIVQDNQNQTLRTYSNLFKIFLLQMYHILILINLNQSKVKIIIRDFEHYLEIRLISVDSMSFLELYRRNMFIAWIEEKILWAPLERDLKIKFSKQLKFLSQ